MSETPDRFAFVTLAEQMQRRDAARQIIGGTLAPDGVLRLNVNIAVDMREFAHWPPQCVSAFMAGLAQCLGAEAHARQSSLPERPKPT